MICMAKRYYAIAKGYKTGIFFTEWDDCKKYVLGYSKPEYQKFSTREAAEEWFKQHYAGHDISDNTNVVQIDDVFGGLILPEKLKIEGELPMAVEEGILNALDVDSLSELSADMIDKLKEDGFFYKDTGETDYHNKVLSYMLLYLPVNFYKLWKPLLECAQNGRLVKEANVLELGPGPGTATMSLMAFYSELALANPQEQFCLKIQAVEREKDFVDLCKKLTGKYIEYLKQIPNLRIEILVMEGDVFRFMYHEERHRYDIIIESNMLNNNECIDENRLEVFVNGLHQNMAEGGVAIMIEPGTSEQGNLLDGLVMKAKCKSRIASLFKTNFQQQDNSRMSFLAEMIDIGLRCRKNFRHGFTYTVLEMTK